jgi:glutathione synthase/RimK-type ligase-like ATP-grasp enzyme
MRDICRLPSVILLADADDLGVARLASELAMRQSVVWWQFGLPESSVCVDVDHTGFCLEQPGTTLCSSHFQTADIVLYKRRVHQPRPLVASDLDHDDERAFSEREWSSLIEGLLLAEQYRGTSKWLNPPSAVALTANKFSLLLLAARAGLDVPAFRVSTPVRAPEAVGAQFITKAISTDEQIDAERHLTTTLLPSATMDRISGARLGTPPLLQEYIAPVLELRVFFVLGRILAYALTPSAEHVDIRHTTVEAMAPRPYDLTEQLTAALHAFAVQLNLNYCTFDLLVPDQGPPALIDVTPNGAWDYFETESSPIITRQIAQIIVASVGGRARVDKERA